MLKVRAIPSPAITACPVGKEVLSEVLGVAATAPPRVDRPALLPRRRSAGGRRWMPSRRCASDAYQSPVDARGGIERAGLATVTTYRGSPNPTQLYFEELFNRAYPQGDLNAMSQRTQSARSIVRGEISAGPRPDRTACDGNQAYTSTPTAGLGAGDERAPLLWPSDSLVPTPQWTGCRTSYARPSSALARC